MSTTVDRGLPLDQSMDERLQDLVVAAVIVTQVQDEGLGLDAVAEGEDAANEFREGASFVLVLHAAELDVEHAILRIPLEPVGALGISQVEGKRRASAVVRRARAWDRQTLVLEEPVEASAGIRHGAGREALGRSRGESYL